MFLGGPRVQVTVSVEKILADQLVKKGDVLPQPIQGFALIDTGASITCVDEEVAQKLKLPVIDVQAMTSASHASVPANIYPVHFQVVPTPIEINLGRAMGANLKPQGLVALIGRDVMRQWTLFYNGLTGEITISM